MVIIVDQDTARLEELVSILESSLKARLKRDIVSQIIPPQVKYSKISRPYVIISYKALDESLVEYVLNGKKVTHDRTPICGIDIRRIEDGQEHIHVHFSDDRIISEVSEKLSKYSQEHNYGNLEVVKS